MRLRLLTWNLHAGVGRDGRLDLDRAASVLREIGPDVAGLQEVATGTGADPAAPQWRFLAEACGMEAVPGPTLVRGAGPYGNALLTRLPVLETRAVDLGVAGREPRGALVALLRVGEETWRVVVTHLGLGIRERAAQARRLVEALSDPTRPTAVLADVNAFVPFSPALRRLRRRFGRPLAAPSFPAWFPVLPLDRIWIWPPRTALRVRVHASPLAREASDHLPVWTELDLEAPTPAPWPAW